MVVPKKASDKLGNTELAEKLLRMLGKASPSESLKQKVTDYAADNSLHEVRDKEVKEKEKA